MPSIANVRRAKSPTIPPWEPSNGPDPVSGSIGGIWVLVVVVGGGVTLPGGGGTTGAVGVMEGSGVAVSVGVRVPVGVWVGVSVGVSVPVGVGDEVNVGGTMVIWVPVGVGVSVIGVSVGVGSGVSVSVGTGVSDGVRVLVGSSVEVGVTEVLVGVGVIPRGCAAEAGSREIKIIPMRTPLIANASKESFDLGMIISPELSTLDQRYKKRMRKEKLCGGIAE